MTDKQRIALQLLFDEEEITELESSTFWAAIRDLPKEEQWPHIERYWYRKHPLFPDADPEEEPDQGLLTLLKKIPFGGVLLVTTLVGINALSVHLGTPWYTVTFRVLLWLLVGTIIAGICK